MKAIKFAKGWGIYVAGDVASFEAETVDQLVADGIGEEVPMAKKAKQEPSA